MDGSDPTASLGESSTTLNSGTGQGQTVAVCASEPGRRACWLGLALTAITILAYLPVWHAGFIWDDDSMLLNNPLIHQHYGWLRAWFTRAADDFVPATVTSLWLEWHVWGANPLGYHLDNVLLHLGSALVLWRILLRLKVPGAWLAAAIFAVHPVNVESVAWVTQRKNTLTMLFFLAAIQFYLTFEDSGRRRWLWLSAGLYLLALAGKTAVVPLPLVLLGLAWWRRGHIRFQDVRHSLPFFALAAAGAATAIWIQRGATAGTVIRTDGFWSRLAGAGWAVWFYLYKAVLPLNLAFVYPRWRIDDRSVLSYVPLVLLLVTFGVLWRWRQRWGRAPFFGTFYYTLMLLPVLGFVNIFYMRYSLVADHWQYFAVIGPIALAAVVLARQPWLGVAVLLTLAALTWRQCEIYTDGQTLWQATLLLNPGCWMARVMLGVADEQQGRVEDAISQYEEALRLNPDATEAHVNLGDIRMQMGQVDDAIGHFQDALRTKPGHAQAENNLGNALLQKGQLDDAIGHFQKALTIRPNYAKARNNLGNALLRQGNVAGAIDQFQQAVQEDAGDASVQNNLAWLLATSADGSLRNGTRAVELAERANEMTHGQSPFVLCTLATAYAEAGRFAEAAATAQKGLRAAQATSNFGLAGQLQLELKLFQAGQPFHSPPPAH